MTPWQRPSMQIPWKIARAFQPLHSYLTLVKESVTEYWKVWNSVKEPTNSYEQSKEDQQRTLRALTKLKGTDSGSPAFQMALEAERKRTLIGKDKS